MGPSLPLSRPRSGTAGNLQRFSPHYSCASDGRCAPTSIRLKVERRNITEYVFQDTAGEVTFFKQKPVLKEVMRTVEEMAERVYGPRRKSEQSSKKRHTSKRSRVRTYLLGPE